MSRKTYGEFWAQTPCMSCHSPKKSNWIARARLVMVQADLQRNPEKHTSEAIAEMVALAGLAYPSMKRLRALECARKLSFEF